MLKLKRFLEGYRKYFFLGPFFKLLEAIFELIVPLVMASIIDVGIKNNDRQYVINHTLLIIILGICGLGFALTCQYFAAKCAFGFGTSLRRSLYSHINKFSYTELDRLGTASLTTRMVNDSTMAQTGVNMFIRLAVRAPFLIIGAAVMALMLDWKLALIFFAAAPLIAFILYKIMKKTIPMYKKNQKRLDRISMLTKENLEGVRVIRAFSRQDDEIKKYDEACDTLADNYIAVGKLSAILNPVTFMIMNLAIVAVVWFGGFRVDTGALSQGDITAFINYMTQILLAMVVLANLIVTFTKAEASANRINEVFETVPQMNDGSLEPDTAYSENAVEFENVSFGYENTGEKSLENISFTIKKGQTIGIIGGTGSGKSTLAMLISRFYDTDCGNVMLFGRNVRDYKMTSLRKIIGVVPQKSVLTSGTILDNLRWADSSLSENDAVNALKTAQAWEFVNKMPDGINSVVAQGGKNFSGGQKQRLSIARAIVRNPAVYIFDDSFSALDYKTDASLRKALSDRTRESTIIIVAQRISTVLNAEQIIVLDEGRIAGIGSHKELLRTCETYRQIAGSQLSKEELAE
ncbi:MAG TPA: ATP-binding protein [Ruminococcus sp.]|nr:ATP-binding protein [Ruminococcus sp.]